MCVCIYLCVCVCVCACVCMRMVIHQLSLLKCLLVWFFFFHALINVRAWLFHTVPVKANQFLCFSPIYVSMCLGHATYITVLDCSQCYIQLLCMCRGDKNKNISQLIHLPARNSHYTADEFKDCLRWKGVVFMARQSCVPSLLVSCGWKTKDTPAPQPN